MNNGTKNDAKNTVIGLIVIAAVIALAWWGISALMNNGNNTSTNNANTKSIANVVNTIENNATAGACEYSETKNGSIDSDMQASTTNFVNLARKITESNKCTVFLYTLYAPTIDDHGNSSNSLIMNFKINSDNLDKFKAYNWGNLQYAKIGEQLQADGILGKISTNFKYVKIDNVKYLGESTDLK